MLEFLPLFLACETILCVLGTLFAASIILSHRWRQSARSKHLRKARFEELFVTGNGAGDSWWVVGWSLMPGNGTGSWVIPIMGFYGYTFGLTGVLLYSITVGLMPAVVAFLGLAAYKNIPRMQSLPASLRFRYGRALEMFTLLIMLVSTAFNLAQEYTAVTRIFYEVLDVRRLIIVGIMAVPTTYYIFFGGAMLGMFTGQVCGLLSFSTIILIAGYYGRVWRDYNPPTRAVLLYGIDKTATQWTCLRAVFGNITLAMFFELSWQKHVCCRKRGTILRGSCMAAALITVCCIFWGVPGMLAAWRDAAEGTSYAGSSPILYLDRSFTGSSIRELWQPLPFWFGVAYLTVVAITSQTAISAYNNAFLSSIYGSVPPSQHRLHYSQVGALVLNGAALVLASFNLDLIGLVTVASMFSVTLGVPLFLSICCKRLHKLATSTDILVSAMAGLLGCFVYSYCRISSTAAAKAMSTSKVVVESITFALYSNTFQWELVCTSVFTPLVVYCLMICSRLTYCWAVDAWHGRPNSWQFELVEMPAVVFSSSTTSGTSSGDVLPGR